MKKNKLNLVKIFVIILVFTNICYTADKSIKSENKMVLSNSINNDKKDDAQKFAHLYLTEAKQNEKEVVLTYNKNPFKKPKLSPLNTYEFYAGLGLGANLSMSYNAYHSINVFTGFGV